MYTPPRLSSSSSSIDVAILALHGAGVDPDPATSSWTSAVPPQRAWIAWPFGLTEWGYDWHGPSLRDAKLAVQHLSKVQDLWGLAVGQKVASRKAKSEERKVIVIGHSNGGQGAWYYMSRFPDDVVGGIPASGYVKIQDYVPYTFSRGQHYRDPFLTGLLFAGLSSFDNDLHASNLAGKAILSRHGGDDDNVPVQHSRELVSAVEAWSYGKPTITYSEAVGAGHWFDDVFDSPGPLAFLDELITNSTLPPPERKSALKFTYTGVNPDELGSMYGFRLVSVGLSGRLMRLTVIIYPSEEPGAFDAEVETTNVDAFSFDAAKLSSQYNLNVTTLRYRGQKLDFSLSSETTFTFSSDARLFTPSPSPRRTRRYGPLISILTSPEPLLIVVGTFGSASTTRHFREIALKIARDAYVYGRVDCVIVEDREVMGREGAFAGEGSVVLLGGADDNGVTFVWSATWPLDVQFIAPTVVRIGSSLFGQPGQGILFLAPNPENVKSLALVLSGTDAEGRESAARLFPVRTGVPLPDWVFPIKSCRGIQIQSSGFTATGLDYDRNWMIVEEKTHKFLTARTVPRMILIGTAISIPDGTLTITVPESSEYPETSFTVPLAPPSDDTAWHPDFKIWSSPALDGWVVGSEECQKLLSAYMGKPVLLIQKGREPREAGPTGYVQGLPGVSLQYTEHPSVSFADEYPILVVGRDSLNHLDHLVMTDKAVQDAQPRFDREKWKDGGIEIQRFRGNVVVKGCEPWVEESWQAVRFIPVEEGAEQEDWEIVSRCGRCQLPNVDPATAIRDPVVPDMFMQETRKTSPTMPTKLCFGVNAVPGRRNASVSLLTRLSRTPRPGNRVYNPSVAVFVAEILKLSVSFTMLVREKAAKDANKKGGRVNHFASAKRALWDLAMNQRAEVIKLSVPAALYATQNTLLYIALSNLDAATYQATYQLKLLTTALFSVAFFRTSLSLVKWLSLLALTVGVATVQLDGIRSPSKSADSGLSDPKVGLAAILAACVSSGLAGAWFEYVLKSPSPPLPTSSTPGTPVTPSPSSPMINSPASTSSSRASSRSRPQLRENSPSLWARNLQLSVPSLCFSLSGVFLSPEWSQVARFGLLDGFTPLVWAVVVNQALGGLLVAMVVREADSVAKGFATSIALVLSTLASMIFLGLVPGVLFIIGAAMVSASTIMYAMDKS
ncbi:UDP-galactose transporter [Pseudohyphozyma bogoriensis]|nr:UDP-galactose transporter [Pseudohyphozyma bogoriensis]